VVTESAGSASATARTTGRRLVYVQAADLDRRRCRPFETIDILDLEDRHAYRTSQEETTMRLSTEVIPRADHTARSTSARSAHEPTVPVRITALSSTTTLTRSMSI
jgi:protein-tyrosine phosphatase